MIGSGRGQLSSMPEFGVRNANRDKFLRNPYYYVVPNQWRDLRRRESIEESSFMGWLKSILRGREKPHHVTSCFGRVESR